MTLHANGYAPSPVGKNPVNIYKPESSPPGEIDRSRFRESLDRAMADKKKVSDNTDKNTQKEIRDQSSDSVKEMVDGKKKRSPESKNIDRKKTAKLSKSKDKAESSEADQIPVLNREMNRAKSVKKSTESTLMGKTGKKGSSLKRGEDGEDVKAGESESLEKSDLEELLLVTGEPELEETDESVDIEKTGAENAQVIPFPLRGESESVNNSDLTKSAKNAPLNVNRSNNKKSKEEQILTVVDTRSNKTEHTKSHFVSKTAAISENVDQTTKESNQIILGEQNVNRLGSEEVKSFEGRFNENKEVLLARELKESGNDQIVKKASFILKDNNQGEIKLILKPESLGRVKIQLNMNENNLVGKIIVENSKVGQIFENNLNDLSRSFEEAGISSSSIEVSVGDDTKQNGDQNKSFQNDQPFFSDRLKTLEEAVPASGRYSSENIHQRINLVV